MPKEGWGVFDWCLIGRGRLGNKDNPTVSFQGGYGLLLPSFRLGHKYNLLSYGMIDSKSLKYRFDVQ